MSKEQEPKLTDHEYDGIREFDNPLPRWWLLTFYLCIIFAIFYYAHYELGSGPSLKAELQQGMTAIEAAKQIAGHSSQPPSEALLVAAFKDSHNLQTGKKIFIEKCASCHLADGGGSIGPNLTDKYWISGDGSLSAIAKVVNNGVADKGMPPWGSVLKEEEIISVVAFVKNLEGTHPAVPKAAQGAEIKN